MMAMDRACGIGDEAAPDLNGQLEVLGGLGMHAVELRAIGGRGVHRLGADELADVGAQIWAAGFSVPVIDTPIGSWATTVATNERAEMDVLERAIAAAHALRCPHLRVMSYPDDGRGEPGWGIAARERLRRLAAVAAANDIVLLHENCHGWAADDPARALQLLEYVDSDALRLVFDIGNGVAHGYDANEYLAAVLPWVRHVHVKDGVTGPDGAVFTIPGEGMAGVAECLRQLVAVDYDGWFSLEPHVACIPHLAATSDPQTLARGFVECAAGFLSVWEQTLAYAGSTRG